MIQLDLAGDELVAIAALRVPRFVDILRLPDTGAGQIEELENRLATCSFDPGLPPERHPYLEVAVRLDRPDSDLRRRCRACCAVRRARQRAGGRFQAQTMELEDLESGQDSSGTKT
ncbi:MAG: exonuclease SbcCD subunit D C-terminal domain-containing protein [Chromatiaceae bacterium]|nr:exonuclease SbcCD subunit D C-terminal domain-containing protein [Chromatiaceae bacterium]